MPDAVELYDVGEVANERIETRVVYWRAFRGCKIAIPERLSQSVARHRLSVACRFNKMQMVTVDRIECVA